ncbi:MAG: class I SAM-dependent methyltransferase [Prolixibacteraceae bacterium]|jgi:ubiquinone/menaquinone biosynthesis C-methylase UbiE|nr:class I SAM-dependent methyltransferase [Prolixibacteraceae bacterium]MBT6005433.1 class I SAM-dependent methyltransferase [Prolixibacteraceae bacterium]MBT6763146.1 class I SAM-dependent methyltransferase [Prolixibacteraceae bacterium]MBT7000201.1 class I SAM-dependent methyltransferase [Prolixibacteraceae bacterium]MBT7393806.1 class I SAM-dependent methyltransferase [Prolixibacteraceae bacterium]
MNKKIYPDSGVELTGFTAKNYDKIMNTMSFGLYRGFIKKAIKNMAIQQGDAILDLGCGTGRNANLMSDYIGESGAITGLDISEQMENQFLQKFKDRTNITFANKRIDQLFDLEKQFDKVFISFVIHGFPHEIRSTVIQNALKHLKPGGAFYILDFAEFDMNKMPAHHRYIFKKVECKYAFDYIERDWKNILKEAGFTDFEENFYLKKYVRLLKAVKAGS